MQFASDQNLRSGAQGGTGHSGEMDGDLSHFHGPLLSRLYFFPTVINMHGNKGVHISFTQ